MPTNHECKQEQRLAKLESDTAVNNTNINNLVKTLDTLADEIRQLRINFKISVGRFIKWFICVTGTFIMILVGIIGFLLKSKLGW